jgi:hypothetical protein
LLSNPIVSTFECQAWITMVDIKQNIIQNFSLGVLFLVPKFCKNI